MFWCAPFACILHISVLSTEMLGAMPCTVQKRESMRHVIFSVVIIHSSTPAPSSTHLHPNSHVLPRCIANLVKASCQEGVQPPMEASRGSLWKIYKAVRQVLMCFVGSHLVRGWAIRKLSQCKNKNMLPFHYSPQCFSSPGQLAAKCTNFEVRRFPLGSTSALFSLYYCSRAPVKVVLETREAPNSSL